MKNINDTNFKLKPASRSRAYFDQMKCWFYDARFTFYWRQMKQNTRSLAQTGKLYYSWYLIMKSPAPHSRFKHLLSGVHTLSSTLQLVHLVSAPRLNFIFSSL